MSVLQPYECDTCGSEYSSVSAMLACCSYDDERPRD